MAGLITNETIMSRDGTLMRQDSGNSDTSSYIPIETLDDIIPIEGPTKIIRVKSGKAMRRKSSGLGAGGGKPRARAQGQITEGAKVTKARARSVNKKVDDSPLGLETAVARRLDWTPPSLNRISTIDLTSGSHGSEGKSHGGSVGVSTLRDALGSFGYESSSSTTNRGATGMTQPSGKPPLKKRRLEMVDIAVQNVAKIAPARTMTKVGGRQVKERAPKKKAQTITELATKDYMPIENVEQRSLMDSFLSQAPVNEGPGEDGSRHAVLVDAMEKANERKRTGRPAGKHGSSRSRLLSPEKAIEAAESQDFFFGTSSQLVREESPSFLRDIQHALKESEASMSQEEPSSRAQEPGSALWTAATRDLDGSLLEAEALDLVKTPKLPRLSRQSTGSGAFHATPTLYAEPSIPDLAPDPGSFAGDSPIVVDMQAPEPVDTGATEEIPYVSLPRSLAEAACKTRPRSRSPVKKSSPVKKAPTRTKKRKSEGDEDVVAPGKTDFNKWSVAQLSHKVKSYGFKPVKGKSALVALLEKCEASMAQRVAPQPLAANTATPPHFAPPPPPPAGEGAEANKPKRGRKPKTDTAATAPAAASAKDSTTGGTEVTPKKRGRPRKADSLAPATVAVDAAISAASANLTPSPKKAATRPRPKTGKSSLEALPDVILVTSSPPAPAASHAGDVCRAEQGSSAGSRDATQPGSAGPACATTPDVARRQLAGKQRAGAQPIRAGESSLSFTGGLDKSALKDGVTAAVSGGVGKDADADIAASDDPNAALLAAVTRAVMASPPTHDPKNPSWREKMLMYDPIVLEDLAIWLNTDGLDAVGVDEEVWPALVRQWCEERSVCCLWRENLKGGSRSRY